MKISICVCTACHVQGSKEVVEKLQKLVAENGLEEKVELSASFCSDKCADGVFVSVDWVEYNLQSGDVERFFQENILAKV